MSFDIFFVGPIDEDRSVPTLLNLVQGAFDKVGATTTGTDWLQVTVRSGMEFEWSSPKLNSDNGKMKHTGAAFLRGIDLDIAECLFEITRQTRWVLIAAMEDVRSVRVDGLPDSLPALGMPEPLDIDSPGELLAFLQSGLRGWQNFRNHVATQQ
jgi:hypothetical protein